MATVADSAEENFSLRQRTKTHYDRKISLTPTGLLMEGHFTSNPASLLQPVNLRDDSFSQTNGAANEASGELGRH